MHNAVVQFSHIIILSYAFKMKQDYPSTSWEYSMPSMEHLYRLSIFRAKRKNHKNSNTEFELFELPQ